MVVKTRSSQHTNLVWRCTRCPRWAEPGQSQRSCTPSYRPPGCWRLSGPCGCSSSSRWRPCRLLSRTGSDRSKQIDVYQVNTPAGVLDRDASLAMEWVLISGNTHLADLVFDPDINVGWTTGIKKRAHLQLRRQIFDTTIRHPLTPAVNSLGGVSRFQPASFSITNTFPLRWVRRRGSLGACRVAN